MPSWLKNIFPLITALLALALGFWLAQALRTPTLTPITDEGHRIEFSLPDLSDKPRHVSEWRGKLTLLNFWATWCPPCKQEIPAFIKLQRDYGGHGLQIVGVALDTKESVTAFREESGINYPILIDQDVALKLMARYGNSSGSLPFSVILARSGEIISRKLGAYSEEELETLIVSLLDSH
jgi:thiol-disulfide isomerase/thioredoxin